MSNPSGPSLLTLIDPNPKVTILMKWDLVIFDCDGVLVDSEPISNATMVEMLAEIGLILSLEESARLFRGRSLPYIFAIVEERLGKPVPDGFLDQLYTRMDAAFQHDLKPVPGGMGVIEVLERMSMPTCVASSGPHRKMQTTLRLIGLLERFEGRIFSAADVGRGKPFPDLFLFAASQMGADPRRCVVIEDALPGVQAAVAAGMSVFGYVPDDITSMKESEAHPLQGAGAQVFVSMADLPTLLGL